METIRRFFREPQQSFFLFGPRGTGKSTLVKGLFPEARYIDLLDAEEHRGYAARPERLRDQLAAMRPPATVIIDEIQKVPALLDMVHHFIERKHGWRFVLTGSSSRKLRRTGVDLLAGRALLLRLHPFMASELGERFSLVGALQNGLVPVVLGSDEPAAVLRSYVALYVREEVQMEGLVRNMGNFSRFLEAASFSHASVLTVSNIARECEVERKVVEGYLGVIEDLHLGYRLPVFSRRAKRELVAHQKYYYFDAGVYRSLRPRGPLDRPEEIEGHALEGLVAQHLLAWADYSGGEATLHYWRTRSGVEVDFVVYGPDGIVAIEVKNGNRVYPRDTKPLRAFREDYPIAKCCLLYRGGERIVQDGVLCLPVEEFLLALRPGVWVGEGI